MALQTVEANITLDLYNHDTTPATVKAIQLDSETRYVAARLQNVGVQYDVDENATVQLIVVRPDKVGVQITGTTFTYGDESSEYLGPYAELTQVALAVSGKMRGQFKITSGTQILRTEIFAISNGEALDASTDEWADEYDGYNLEEMATSIETNTADIATLETDVSQIKEEFTDMRADVGIISYWGADRTVSAYGYSVTRHNNSVTLTGTGTSTTGRWKLTGAFSYTSSLNGVKAWDKELNLPKGKYLIAFYFASGETTVAINPFIRGYDVDNNQLFEVQCGTNYEFDWDGGNILIAQTNGSAVYTNATYKVDIYDATDLNRINNLLDMSTREYPSYYDAPINTYIASVNAELASIGRDGFAFIFVTDQHVEYNVGYTPKIIKKIYENTPIKYVVNGGDIFDRDTTKAGGYAKLAGYITQYKFLGIPIFTTQGNHDLSQNSNTDHTDAYLSMSEFYGLAMSQMENVVYYDSENGKYHYYYYDSDTNTYLICLQTGGSITESDATSFLQADANVLAALLPTLDGNIIIFTHQLNTLDSGYPHNNSWTRLINAINNSGSASKVKLIISGHTHTDMSDTSDGFIHVVTTTDSHKYLDQYLGTTDELAFDTVFVNYNTGKVKTLRFGRGSDRELEVTT